MTSPNPNTHHLMRLISLRWLIILVELVLLLLWGGESKWVAIIALQFTLQALSLVWFKSGKTVTPPLLAGQLAADLLLLTCLLYLTGGATNAYVSALLIPVALAAVMLKPIWLFQLLGLAIACYSSLLFGLPNHVHHIHDMQSHFIGMWVNFLLTALVVAFVVAAIARELRQREVELAEQKMQALREQQLLALGAAAAQTVHDLATPVATLSLLQEEVQDAHPDNSDVKAMQSPLASCQASLERLRQVTEQLREQKTQRVSVESLVSQLHEQSQLLWPEVKVNCEAEPSNRQLRADASLMPALMNLVQNAVQSAKADDQPELSISSQIELGHWHLEITNATHSEQLLKLTGDELVDSEQGFGMALLLTRTVIERLGGELNASSQHQQVRVQVHLPLEAVT